MIYDSNLTCFDTVSYTYDNGNITNKQYSYKIDGEAQTVGFVNEYDNKGRITATGYSYGSEHFTYDGDGQLTRVDNGTNADRYTAAYSYDSRGNVTSKNVYDYTRNETITSAPNETTTFAYANYGWKDLLVAVNGVELTYDENGNVLTYGDREYSWNTGRHLESITDGNNEYSYTYDESGIRTSKTVNGVTTYYNTSNGVILSQTDGTNTMYFQYDTNGTPLGFIYNGTQYLYMTNQMGDVISITDAQGNELAEYEYDEWGKLILTRAGNQSNESIANINPIRYRGYYYDTETGYYYLQSRYYDPSICKFINSDIPEIAGMSKGISAGTNLFAYCNNEPVNQKDPTGTVAIALGATTIGIILIAALAAIGISWALSTIIRNIDYSFVSQTLNDLYKKYKLKAAVIKALVIGTIKPAYKYVKKQVKSKAKAISKALSIAVADAKVKTIIKNDRRYNYWVAYMSHGVLILGSRLSKNSAISRIRRGLNVMSRSQSYAKSVAYMAGGNRKPKGPEKHGNLGQGYYWHYHIYRHINNSHIFFI